MATGLVETKSPVWRYFAFEAVANRKPKDIDKPKCKLCQEEVTARFENTSNLYTYVKNKHPSIYTNLAQERQESWNSTKGKDSSPLWLLLFSKRAGSSIGTQENTRR